MVINLKKLKLQRVDEVDELQLKTIEAVKNNEVDLSDTTLILSKHAIEFDDDSGQGYWVKYDYVSEALDILGKGYYSYSKDGRLIEV